MSRTICSILYNCVIRLGATCIHISTTKAVRLILAHCDNKQPAHDLFGKAVRDQEARDEHFLFGGITNGTILIRHMPLCMAEW